MRSLLIISLGAAITIMIGCSKSPSANQTTQSSNSSIRKFIVNDVSNRPEVPGNGIIPLDPVANDPFNYKHDEVAPPRPEPSARPARRLLITEDRVRDLCSRVEYSAPRGHVYAIEKVVATKAGDIRKVMPDITAPMTFPVRDDQVWLVRWRMDPPMEMLDYKYRYKILALDGETGELLGGSFVPVPTNQSPGT